MRIIDVTPKSTFYVRRYGKIVACRFSEIQIMVPSMREDRRDTNFVVYADVVLANGEKFNTNYNTPDLLLSLYPTPQDCYDKTNKVVFTLTNNDFYTALVVGCGCTPSIKGNSLYVWTYNHYSMTAGLDKIECVYLFRKSVVTATANKWYNTQIECINANKPKVVKFADDVDDSETIAMQRPKRIINIEIEVY